MSDMSLESFGAKAYDNTVQKPVNNIVSAVRHEPNILGKASTGVAEIAKEAAFIPLRNIGSIMNWSVKSMEKVFGSALKLVGSAALLVPLPFPSAKNGHTR